MRPIKVAAWIATSLFTLWFFIRIAALSNIQTRYGSPATSPPVILGLLLGCALIPGILWIIVAATGSKNATQNPTQSKSTSEKKNKISSTKTSNNPEIAALLEQLKVIETERDNLKETYAIVKNSYQQNLLSEEKFQFEDSKLRNEFDKIIVEKKSLNNRIKALENLRPVFDNLLALKEKGIITDKEYSIKRDEIIRNYNE